eukprot:SAG25_NODE_3915_length_930_cov_1.583634_2_plen_129_part_00
MLVFTGPSGVGKTELGERSVARLIFPYVSVHFIFGSDQEILAPTRWLGFPCVSIRFIWAPPQDLITRVVPMLRSAPHRRHGARHHPERDAPGGLGAASLASFVAAAVTEIYLCNVCFCQEILRRNGRG